MKTALTIFAALAVVMTDSTVAASKLNVRESLAKETPCVDTARFKKRCPGWVRAGYCKKSHVGFMKRHCKESCGLCPKPKPKPDEKLKKLQIDLQKAAKKLVTSLNHGMKSMDRAWDAPKIVSLIKDDSEIVENIKNNSANIARDREAFKKVVEEIKNYKPDPSTKPDPAKVKELQKQVALAEAHLAETTSKKGLDFQKSLDIFQKFLGLYNKEKKAQGKSFKWTKAMTAKYEEYTYWRKVWSTYDYTRYIEKAQEALKKAEKALADLQNGVKHVCIQKHTLGQCQRCTTGSQCGSSGKDDGSFCCPYTKLCMKRGRGGCSSSLSAKCTIKPEYKTTRNSRCWNNLTAEKCDCKHKDWNSAKWQDPTCAN